MDLSRGSIGRVVQSDVEVVNEAIRSNAGVDNSNHLPKIAVVKQNVRAMAAAYEYESNDDEEGDSTSVVTALGVGTDEPKFLMTRQANWQ